MQALDNSICMRVAVLRKHPAVVTTSTHWAELEVHVALRNDASDSI